MKHDYQCNASMSLAKLLKNQNITAASNSRPRDIAQQIVDNLPRLIIETVIINRKYYY